jgi:hypothetical protein
MAAWLQQVWHYEIQVVPVLLAMLVIEIPTAVRRLQKFYYVPIYFSVFPLRELNTDLAYYLGEDYVMGGEPEEDRAERLRKKILTTSIISIALSALVIPLFAGFGSAFFLVPPLVRQFILVFVVYKSIGIIRAIIGFPSHAVGTRRNLALLILIYIGYLGVASRMILNSYGFARPFVESHDWIGLASVTSDLLFSRVMVEFLLLALITTAFTNFIMDRKVRRENLRRFQTDEYSDPASSP